MTSVAEVNANEVRKYVREVLDKTEERAMTCGGSPLPVPDKLLMADIAARLAQDVMDLIGVHVDRIEMAATAKSPLPVMAMPLLCDVATMALHGVLSLHVQQVEESAIRALGAAGVAEIKRKAGDA